MVRRNIVIRGRSSLLLVIRVVIREVLRLVAVLRWAFGRAPYRSTSFSLPFRALALFVMSFVLSRSTGFVGARCGLEVGTSDSSPYSFSEFEVSPSRRVHSGSGASP